MDTIQIAQSTCFPTTIACLSCTLQTPLIVSDRYTNKLQAFQLVGNQYQPQALVESRLWLPSLELGLGLWQGEYHGLHRLWLRWYDAGGNWIPLEAEQERQRAEQEYQRAEQERQRAERLAKRLREAGIDSGED